MELLAIFDIDGTLADFSRRMKEAGDAPPRHHRRKFQQWLDGLQGGDKLLHDDVIVETFLLAEALSKSESVRICYLTGRSESNREMTQAWLKKHGFPSAQLFMRAKNDFRSAAGYKEEKTKEAIRTLGHKGRVLIVDDDHSGDCNEVYVEHGWCHLKVQAV